MSGKPTSVNDNDLHAFLDGELAPARAAEVEAWLADHPEAAGKVAAWRAQHDALHALFDPVLDEPVPAHLTRLPARRSWWPTPRALAATVAWLAIGGLIGYTLHGWQAPPVETTQLAERAALAHVVYTAEVLHPVEVTTEQESHMVQWLSKRLGRELHTPDFSGLGYQLMGGRLLPGDKGPAAQFMYQNPGGVRLTLYVSVPGKETPQTAFRYEEEGNAHVLYWVDRDLGFALVGEADRTHLMEFAHVAYKAFNF